MRAAHERYRARFAIARGNSGESKATCPRPTETRMRNIVKLFSLASLPVAPGNDVGEPPDGDGVNEAFPVCPEARPQRKGFRRVSGEQSSGCALVQSREILISNLLKTGRIPLGSSSFARYARGCMLLRESSSRRIIG